MISVKKCRLLQLFVFASVVAISISAQDGESPFRNLDDALRKEPANWAGSKENLSKAFNADRIRLGDRVVPELLKYLADDIDRHYWISAFLEHSSYLHGNERLPYLALLVKQQGLALLKGREDRKSRGDRVSLSVTATVLSAELGLLKLAEDYKKTAEQHLAADAGLRTRFPGMSRYNHCLYEAIGSGDLEKCKREPVEPDPSEPRTVISGILNGAAINLPEPVVPEAAKILRASGTVEVAIVVDVDGNVESAEAISGHPLLRSASVKAARQAKFKPMLLAGRPAKRSGRLIFTFERD
ncbi:MAG TPA: energy transducer TonB [Aridibacter sp.]|nr:energy transducer TonB [Aridibacter sp.]